MELNANQKANYLKARNLSSQVIDNLTNINGPFGSVKEQEIVRAAMERFWETIDYYIKK